jgi:hypothetical protein
METLDFLQHVSAMKNMTVKVITNVVAIQHKNRAIWQDGRHQAVEEIVLQHVVLVTTTPMWLIIDHKLLNFKGACTFKVSRISRIEY